MSSLEAAEWERIHQTLIETDFNISEAARRLGMPGERWRESSRSGR